MRFRKPFFVAALVACSGAACQLYPSWNGEFSAGPADPVNYPPAYVGVSGDHSKSGAGTFTQLRAFSEAAAIGYFSFPFASTVLPLPAKNPPDPLLLSANGVASTIIPAPQVFVFDPTPGSQPFPKVPKCVAPSGYVYDQQHDEVSYADQGNIFTALPNATYSLTKAASWAYEPIVAETAISSNGEDCQGIKSQTTVTQSLSAKAQPDGHYLAWPIIDGGAAVYRVGESLNAGATGLAYQHWGWFNHYLVAYLDGGYIPTDATAAADGSPQVHMVAQKLYYPVSKITIPTTASGTPTCATNNGGCPTTATCDESTGKVLCTGTGAIGQGYDVIAAPRGSDGYSPVCQVFTYKVATTVTPGQLPQDAATIESASGPYKASITAASTPYIFCLQVQ